MIIQVGVSARHVHLSKQDLQLLFGEDYKLTKKADLTQPGQFASEETVTIKGSKSSIERVRILGPVREQTQVEISLTDSFKLGINAPLRLSGDLKDAGEVTIIGPNGEIKRNAAIVAARHIHATPDDAKKYGLTQNSIISLKIKGEREGILDNIKVRINDNFFFETHIDTDEANAFLIKNGDKVEFNIKEF